MAGSVHASIIRRARTGWLGWPQLGQFISVPYDLLSSSRLAQTCFHSEGKVLGREVEAHETS